MKVLVFGSGGQLGRELRRAPLPAGVEIVTRSHKEQDIADEVGVRALIASERPAFVINAAAYTAVDAAESDQAAAFRANAEGPGILARACAEHQAALIHVSTDYIFDGTQSAPYVEDDAPRPLGVYGQTKLDGELAVRGALPEHLIVRTSWVYSSFGQNFVAAILRLAKEREQLRIVADQFGRPTSAAELAKVLLELTTSCSREQAAGKVVPWGTYHFAGLGRVSRYELAQYIVALQAPATGREPKLEPIETSSYPTPARRPLNAVLDTTKIETTFAVKPEPWQGHVASAVRELSATK
jgi:dTDP-4-dehydrorhamnose reductase